MTKPESHRVPSIGAPGAVDIPELEARLHGLLPLYGHIGLRIVSLGDVLACTVPFTEANANHLGAVHAAVQWAAAEALGGLAYFAHPEFGECWIAVRDVSIDFKRVARTALRAEAVFDAPMVRDVAAQLAAHGRADYEIHMMLRDTSGGVVTTAVGHYVLRKP
jgi:acyl-coenzyme A thioesterase PaaI-like protein